MAVIGKNAKASIQLKDYERKTICTYGGVDPAAAPDSIALFAEGVNELLDEEVEHTEIVTTTELEEQ